MKYLKNYLIFEKNQQQQNIIYYFIIQKGEGITGIGEIGYIYVFIVTQEEYNQGLNATEKPIPYLITNILNNYGGETEDAVWEIPEQDEQIVRTTLINNGLEEKPFIYPPDRQPQKDIKGVGWFSDEYKEIDHITTNNLLNLERRMRYKIKNPEYIVFVWNKLELIIGKITEQVISNLRNVTDITEEDLYTTFKIETIDSITHHSYPTEKVNQEYAYYELTNDDRMNVILQTPNKTEAIQKFQNLKKQKPYSNWILKRIANKYNL